jgi:thiamine biosynthesis lipoprotein
MLASGRRAGSADDTEGWTVALRHPLRHEQRLGEITLRDRALGTSGSGNQFFHFAGKRYGHVIDPRTGYPADGVLSATVLAPTAAQADALATAFFVMGPEDTLSFCQAHPELGALLVCPGEQIGSVEILAVGIDDSVWRPIV